MANRPSSNAMSERTGSGARRASCHGGVVGASRRGFSLIELGVSSAMAGVLLVSMASVVVLAAKALPAADGSGAKDAAASSAGGLDQFLAELRCATEVTSAGPSSIAFTMADRDGDDLEEALEYSWGGPGQALRRSVNGSGAAAVTGPLQDFGLTYSRRVTTTTTGSTGVWDSGEVLFSSFNGWLGLTASLASIGVNASTWASQLFAINRVSIPPDATKVVITRVSLEMRRPSSPAGTTLTMAIHRPESPGSSIPASEPVGTPVTTLVSQLSTGYTWVESQFSDVEVGASDVNLMIVVKGSSTSSATLKYMSSSIAPADEYIFRYTTNSGSSWQPSGSLNYWDAPFFVYGRYERPLTTTASVEAHEMTTVGITMRGGPGSRDWVHTQVELLNKPLTPAP
jgi:hypothetical protein